MIRYANKFDLDTIYDLLKDFGKKYNNEFDILNCNHDSSKEYVYKQLTNILSGCGFILIAEDKSGVLCAIKNPSLWIKDAFVLQEGMWHGLNKKTTLRLLKKYLEIGKKMKENGEVKEVYFSSYKDIDYKKLKVKKLSYHWVM
jgi:hypothetical protein